VVSDLVCRRPIWFGGEDRSEASMAAFYDRLGLKKSHKINPAVTGPFSEISSFSVAAHGGLDYIGSN
jgi:hypothetical protein